jgi:DNA-binding SARP family transcriptional activator
MRLLTLGDFSLLPDPSSKAAAPSSDQGNPPPLLRASKPLALLAIAALSPGRRVARHQLLDLLWERADPEASAQTLRQTVFTLRKRLGADWIAASDSKFHTPNLS